MRTSNFLDPHSLATTNLQQPSEQRYLQLRPTSDEEIICLGPLAPSAVMADKEPLRCQVRWCVGLTSSLFHRAMNAERQDEPFPAAAACLKAGPRMACLADGSFGMIVCAETIQPAASSPQATKTLATRPKKIKIVMVNRNGRGTEFLRAAFASISGS